MLDNKILVNLYVLSLGKYFELYLPVNEKVGNISKLLNTSLFENGIIAEKLSIINSLDGTIYNDNDIVRDTSIKNGSKLILF